jgi:hypothetical protein
MATTFKTLTTDDVTNTRTLLYEQIPLTGTIFSGTYSSSAGELNILNYSHKMFQTVYDYPYLSSSANDLFDVTYGISSNSVMAASSQATTDKSKKISIYNQMAKTLVGYDSTGSIKLFDYEASTNPNGNKISNGFFLTFSRLLVKDEIKKGSFKMKLGLGQSDTSRFGLTGTIVDYSGTLNPPGYLTNSPVGDVGLLYISESINDQTNFPTNPHNDNCGLIFYQAGVVLLSGQTFQKYSAGVSEFTNMSASAYGQLSDGDTFVNYGSSSLGITALAGTASIDGMANALRRRISNIEFQNTTELNSTIYFLRINNNEFNYSSNPTYLSSSQIRVKNGNPANAPVSYITTAGLYSPDNELLAVAKLSQPLKKTEEQSMILRVRLDY